MEVSTVRLMISWRQNKRGFDNRYGHPSQSYSTFKSSTYSAKSTVEQGTLNFVLENHKIVLHDRRLDRLWLSRGFKAL